jgi:hypothetical protein
MGSPTLDGACSHARHRLQDFVLLAPIRIVGNHFFNAFINGGDLLTERLFGFRMKVCVRITLRDGFLPRRERSLTPDFLFSFRLRKENKVYQDVHCLARNH